MKEKIKEYLKNRNFDQMLELLEPSKLTRTLISLSYDKTDELGWRSIEAIGRIVYLVSKDKPDFEREMIRRLLWSIRDEAGGIGWSSPEIIGEIVKHEPSKYPDIPKILWSFMGEEFLRKGIIWAIGRIGEVSPEFVEDFIPFLRLIARNDRDEEIRFYAIWVLCKMGEDISGLGIEIKGDFTIYDDGELKSIGISNLRDCKSKSQSKKKDIPFIYEEDMDFDRKEYPFKGGSLICPFCNSPVDRPRELKKGLAEVVGGICRCGALYAFDPSGRALGETLIDGLAILCNGDYNKAISLDEGRDYIIRFLFYEPYLNRLSGSSGSSITSRRMIFIKIVNKISNVHV